MGLFYHGDPPSPSCIQECLGVGTDRGAVAQAEGSTDDQGARGGRGVCSLS